MICATDSAQMSEYSVQYTDTFCGEAAYSWVDLAVVTMPDLSHYGYIEGDAASYAKANRTYQRELMRKAKAAVGITGVRGRRSDYGDMIEFRPYGRPTVMFVTWREGAGDHEQGVTP
jgi:hypothetical protein